MGQEERVEERLAALIGGSGIHKIPTSRFEPVNNWVRDVHHNTHEFVVIFSGEGPWVMCMDCEWSDDLPEDVAGDI